MITHLIQSTIFAAVIGILTLAFRNNRARIRYWLWLSASIKFLIPFSLLVSLGEWLKPSALTTPLPSTVTIVLGELTAPSLTPPAGIASANAPIFPGILITLWIAGCVTALTIWIVRWNRIRSTMRSARPLTTGREAASLERLTGSRSAVDLVLAAHPMEPAVFGVLHPVISLPIGMADRLDDHELDAVLAHELCHIRNCDNLLAAIHTAISAIFWFHPLLWWIGARIVEERERACDEDVLARGAVPELYGEAILKICRFYLQSPVTCASGISGADLSRRIEEIIRNPKRRAVGIARKSLLITTAIGAIAAPVTVGLFGVPAFAQTQWHIDGTPVESAAAASKLPAFEVASIKPSEPDSQLKVDFAAGGKLFISNATLRFLIKIAYNVSDDQIKGGPAWLSSKRFDLQAKPATSLGGDPQTMTKEQIVAFHAPVRLRLQRLLAERFQLELSKESTPMPIFALTVAKGGPKKLAPSKATEESKVNSTYGHGILTATATDMAGFANFLSEGQTGRPVVDATGLNGKYDFHLEWTPDPSQNPAANAATAADPAGISIFTALQQQLGLKLEPQTGNAERLVIIDARLPSAN